MKHIEKLEKDKGNNPNEELTKWLNDAFKGLGEERPGRLNLWNNVNDLAPLLADSFLSYKDEEIQHQGQLDEFKKQADYAARIFMETSPSYADAAPAVREAYEAAFKAEMDKPENKLGAGASEKDYQSREYRVQSAVRDVEKWVSDYTKNPAALGKMAEIDNARANLDANKTATNLDTYNKLISDWNTQFGGIYSNMNTLLADTILPSAEELAAKADEAAKASEKPVDPAKKLNTYLDKRRDAKSAALEGFDTQVSDIGLLMEGSDKKWQGITPLKQYMDVMKTENDELYNDMLTQYPAIIDMMNGKWTGSELLAQWGAIREQVAGAAVEAKNLKSESEKNVTTPTADMSSANQVGVLMKALMGGGEEGGVTALLSQLDMFDEKTKASLVELIPMLSTLNEKTTDYDTLMSALRENTNGTWESMLYDFQQYSGAIEDSPDSLQKGADAVSNLMTALTSGKDGVAAFTEAWDALGTNADRDKLRKLSPIFEEIIKGTKGAEEGAKGLNKVLVKLETKKLVTAGKLWEEVGEAVDDMDGNTNDLGKSYAKFNKRLDTTVEAVKDYNYVSDKANVKTDQYKTSLGNLSSYMGYTIQSESDLATVQQYLAGEMNGATTSAAWLMNALAAASGVTFSAANWQSELAALSGSANSAGGVLAALAKRLLGFDGARISLTDGVFNVTGLGASGMPNIDKPSGGGGGGGGKKDNTADKTKVTRALQDYIDTLKSATEIADFRIELLNLTKELHEQRGELTAVIALTEREIKQKQEMAKADKAAEASIRSQMEAKQAEVAA